MELTEIQQEWTSRENATYTCVCGWKTGDGNQLKGYSEAIRHIIKEHGGQGGVHAERSAF